MTDNLDNIIEVEKQNIITTYNDSSGSGKKKDQYYITISDDGKYIARLDCSKGESLRLKITHHENFELLNNDDNDSGSDKGQDKIKICDIVKKLTFLDELNPYVKPLEDNSKQEEQIKKDNIKQKGNTKGDNRKQEQTKKDNREQEEQIKKDNRKLLTWSFSISNMISFNSKPTILVAISRVVPNDMIDRDRPINHLHDKLKEYKELKLEYQNMKELHYYPLHSQPSSSVIFYIDISDIYKNDDKSNNSNYEIKVDENKVNETCLTSNIGGIVRFLPEVEKTKTSLLITNVKGFYKSLDDLDKPNIYSKLKTQKYGTPAYAISLNNLLLAFTRGNNDIRIYSMESGLFIALKSLDNKEEVLFLEFIHDDERLFIITQNDTNHEISIKIWDIFNSSPEDFKYKINNNIIPKKIDCLNIARSNGMIFFVKEDGKVLNVLKNIEFKEFKVFENDDDNNGIKEEKSFTVFKNFKKVDKYLNHWYYCAEDDSDKHKIFDPFEKHGDLGGPKTLLLVDNKEKLVDVDQITPLVNNKEQWNLRVGCRKFELEVTWELTDNSIGINFKLEDTKSNTLQNSAKKISFKKVAFGKDNQNRTNEIKDKIVQKAEGKNKHNKVPFNLCVVPLPNFTVNKIEKKKKVVTTFLAFLRRFILPHNNVYENTSQQSKLELLKLQATFISDYEALDLEDDFLNPPKPDPKYICYNNNNLDSWKERTKSRRGCLYAKYENDNSYIQYILEKKDFDHQDGSLWQIYNKLDDFNDDDVNEKISNLEKKMDAKMDNIMLQLQQLQQLLQRP
ncbi:6807_t:CDS:2 [Entrophospora sp. SA101]|nr:6807_t:CDS:2 [Entrophospora sp. SA101]